MKMKMMIYAIGGRWALNTSFGDTFVGCAHDAVTASSLLDLVESKGGYAVSLHGDNLGCLNAISGECGMREARTMVALWQAKEEIKNEAVEPLEAKFLP
jgi:hypothetical protein